MVKKLMIACAVMTCAVGLLADPGVSESKASVTAAGLVYTNTTDFSGGIFKDIDKVTIVNDTAVTGTAVIYMVDQGVATSIGTSGALTTGTSAVVYPRRSYTEAWSGFVVTSDVQVASTALTTKYALYPAKQVKIVMTLAGTNGTAWADALKFSVYHR